MSKKTARMTVRMTQKQKVMIQQKADLVGLSMSSFLISCALKSRVDGYGQAKKDALEVEEIDGQMTAENYLNDDDFDSDFFDDF